MEPEDTPLGKRLTLRQGDALAQWQEARAHLPFAVSDEDWNQLLSNVARPLTWRLWKIAIEESDRVRARAKD